MPGPSLQDQFKQIEIQARKDAQEGFTTRQLRRRGPQIVVPIVTPVLVQKQPIVGLNVSNDEFFDPVDLPVNRRLVFDEETLGDDQVPIVEHNLS